MLRWIVLLVAVLPLAACEADEGWVPDNVWPFADSESAGTSVQQAEDPHCRKVAYARAADARANGLDDETGDRIYSGTYADCLIWDRAHAQAAAN